MKLRTLSMGISCLMLAELAFAQRQPTSGERATPRATSPDSGPKRPSTRARSKRRDRSSDGELSPSTKPRENDAIPEPPATTRMEVTPAAPSEQESSSFRIGVAARGGWEGRYANGFSMHFLFNEWLNLHIGAGLNNSGPKFGGGADLDFYLGSGIGVFGGGSLIFSAGSKGEVSLTAKFLPEGSTATEDLGVAKDYVVTQAQLLAAAAGAYYKLGGHMRLFLEVGYNAVIGGNQLSFPGDIRYDQNVEVLNENQFAEEFAQEAEGYVAAGGPGATLGIMLIL